MLSMGEGFTCSKRSLARILKLLIAYFSAVGPLTMDMVELFLGS
jgi:hypothetical protein